MIYSFLFVILFFCLLFGIIIYPQKKECVNVIQILPIKIVVELCMLVIGAYIIQKFGIYVDIKSTSVFLLIVNLVVWYGVIKARKFQKLVWAWKDLIMLASPTVLVIIEAYHMFSGSLRLSYLNDDAQTHFFWAMNIVRTGKLEGTFFNAYLNAILIELIEPFVKQVYYYKVFILSDIFMHILEIEVFYAVVCSIFKKRNITYLAPIICIMYFLGYPTFSFMRGNFVYWSTGGILYLLVIYILLNIEKNWKERRSYWISLIICLLGSILCNRLYAVINIVSVLSVYLLLWLSEENRGFTLISKKVLISFVLITVTLVFIFQKKIIYVVQIFAGALSEEGYTYTSLYRQFILFIPVLIFVFASVYLKKKRKYLVCNLTVLLICITIGMYRLYVNEMISGYYYYKIYYSLWIMVWLIVAMAVDVLYEERKLYLGGIYILGLICFALSNSCEYKKIGFSDNVDYFSFYNANFQYFKMDYTSEELAEKGRYISQQELDTYQYIQDHYKNQEVWFISDAGNYMRGRWFAALLGQTNVTLYGEYVSYIENYLDTDNLYLLLAKKSWVYEEAKDVINIEGIVYEDNTFIMVKSNK